MTVDRGEQHVAALIENRLRAIAVVIVDVEDRDPLVALIEERLRGDGSVVEVAITAHQIAGSVVSGGRHKAKALRAPRWISACAVRATCAALYAACQVPAVIGAPPSKL